MMKKSLVIFVLLVIFPIVSFALDVSADLVVSAEVRPILSISMTSSPLFQLVGNDGNVIPSHMIGDAVVKSNSRNWTISISSFNKLSPAVGRLKMTDVVEDVYIPYTFELKNGSNVIVSQFDTPSGAQGITTKDGKALSLVFYFSDPAEREMWQNGTYKDTITLVVASL